MNICPDSKKSWNVATPKPSLVTLLITMGVEFGFLLGAVGAFPPVVKLDCSVNEIKEEHIGKTFKVANFIFTVGPEVSVNERIDVAWDKVVHGSIDHYVELCNRYNAGLVTKVEYEARLKEIEALYKETKEMEAKLYAATRQHARESHDELDAAVGRRARPPLVNVSLESQVQGDRKSVV